MTDYRLNFETLGEYLTYAKQPAIQHERTDSRDQGGAWAGTPSFEAAVDLVENGWAEGRKMLLNALAEVDTSPNQGTMINMDVGGAYPIAAIAAAGDPLSMVALERVEDRVRPIVRLVVERCGSSAYKASEFMNYGAAVLSYIEGLERMNFRVEVMVSFGFSFYNGKALFTIMAKRAEEHIEFDRMAFVLAHPSMLRRIQFSVSERVPGFWKDMGGGYGSPRTPEPSEVDPNQIILPGVNMVSPGSPHLKSAKACLEHIGPMIEGQLRNAGLAPPPLAFGGDNK